MAFYMLYVKLGNSKSSDETESIVIFSTEIKFIMTTLPGLSFPSNYTIYIYIIFTQPLRSGKI